MTAKLIFSDIDGTLITSDGDVSPATIDAIRKQIIAGSLFIPVSARMPKGIMNVVDKITNFCPIIAYNGALVLDEMGRPLNSQFFDAAKAVKLINEVKSIKNSDLAWNVYSGYNWFSSLEKSSLVEKEEKIVGVKSLPVSIDQIKDLKGVHKMLIIGDPDTLNELLPTLQQKFSDLSFVKAAPQLLEIIPKGINKGKAVEIVLDSFAVDKSNAWAFGDNYNDEAMLRAVGHPFLMGNAPEDFKNKVNFPIILDNDHDGVVAVLNKISN